MNGGWRGTCAVASVGEHARLHVSLLVTPFPPHFLAIAHCRRRPTDVQLALLRGLGAAGTAEGAVVGWGRQALVPSNPTPSPRHYASSLLRFASNLTGRAAELVAARTAAACGRGEAAQAAAAVQPVVGNPVLIMQQQWAAAAAAGGRVQLPASGALPISGLLMAGQAPVFAPALALPPPLVSSTQQQHG